MSSCVRLPLRIAILRREAKQLGAIAAERAAQAERPRATSSYRALTEAETVSLVGVDLLATLAGTGRRD